MKGGGAIHVGAFLGQHPLDLAHRHVPVAARRAFEPLPFGPIGGVDAGAAIERRHCKPAIVGERSEARGFRRRARLQQRVLHESGAGLGRLGQAERSGRQALDPVWL
jgi:hypothetical protein